MLLLITALPSALASVRNNLCLAAGLRQPISGTTTVVPDVCKLYGINMADGLADDGGGATASHLCPAGALAPRAGVRIFCAVVRGQSNDCTDPIACCEAARLASRQSCSASNASEQLEWAMLAYTLCPRESTSIKLSHALLGAYEQLRDPAKLGTYSGTLLVLPWVGIRSLATFTYWNIEAGNTGLAVSLGQKGVDAYPEHPRLRYLYGVALAHLGEKELAVTQLCRASQLAVDAASRTGYARAAKEVAGRTVDCELHGSWP